MDKPLLTIAAKPWNGVDASDRVPEWTAQCIDWLQRHPEERDTRIMSGDTLVLVTRREIGNEVTFEVMVTKIESVTSLPASIEVQPQDPWEDFTNEETPEGRGYEGEPEDDGAYAYEYEPEPWNF